MATDRQIDKDEHTPIVANAARLLADAQLLKENGRYASAFALAVLASEEIGKVILRLWGVPEPKGRRYDHRSKQMAVASLLLGKFAVEQPVKGMVSPSSSASSLRTVERLAEAMGKSHHWRFLKYVNMALIDKAKQLAFYQDELSLDRVGFTDKIVGTMFQKCHEANNAVSNENSMAVGKAIFVMVRAQQSRRRR